MYGPVVLAWAEGERAAQMWKGGNLPFWEQTRNGISRGIAESHCPCRAEDKPSSGSNGGMCI